LALRLLRLGLLLGLNLLHWRLGLRPRSAGLLRVGLRPPSLLLGLLLLGLLLLGLDLLHWRLGLLRPVSAGFRRPSLLRPGLLLGLNLLHWGLLRPVSAGLRRPSLLRPGLLLRLLLWLGGGRDAVLQHLYLTLRLVQVAVRRQVESVVVNAQEDCSLLLWCLRHLLAKDALQFRFEQSSRGLPSRLGLILRPLVCPVAQHEILETLNLLSCDRLF
jgi:hypothetical protein